MEGKKKALNARSIAFMGLLMAMQIVLTRFLAIETPFVRISFSFIPTVLMACFFGPLLTATGSAITDFLGVMLFPKTGAYFPGFTISAILTGLIYGYFFYKKEMTLTRVIVAKLVVVVGISMILNTFWLYLMMGSSIWGFLPTRIIKDCILFPIQVFVIYVIGNKGVLKNQITKLQNQL